MIETGPPNLKEGRSGGDNSRTKEKNAFTTKTSQELHCKYKFYSGLFASEDKFVSIIIFTS
jgi:hypothetical protein